LGHVLRGRGRFPVYVVVNGLSDAGQAEIDERDLTISKTGVLHTHRDPFVVIAASAKARSETVVT